MTKKDKFIRLVKLASAKRHQGYILQNTYYAMFVQDECIPEEKGGEELLQAVEEYVSYLICGGLEPEWLEYEDNTF